MEESEQGELFKDILQTSHIGSLIQGCHIIQVQNYAHVGHV